MLVPSDVPSAAILEGVYHKRGALKIPNNRTLFCVTILPIYVLSCYRQIKCPDRPTLLMLYQGIDITQTFRSVR